MVKRDVIEGAVLALVEPLIVSLPVGQRPQARQVVEAGRLLLGAFLDCRDLLDQIRMGLVDVETEVKALGDDR